MPCQSLGMSELWEHWEARVAEETKTAGRAAPGKREDQQTRGTESQQEVHSLQEQLWCFSKYCLELPNMKRLSPVQVFVLRLKMFLNDREEQQHLNAA